MRGNVANALARKRQVFGMRGHSNAIGIVWVDLRVGHTIVEEFFIGLVADEIDLCTKLRLLLPQQHS